MEQWEIDLRAKLEKEIEPGAYQYSLGRGRGALWTGKGGAIDIEVAMAKEGRKILEASRPSAGIMKLIEDGPKAQCGVLSYDRLKSIIEDFFYPKDNHKTN